MILSVNIFKHIKGYWLDWEIQRQYLSGIWQQIVIPGFLQRSSPVSPPLCMYHLVLGPPHHHHIHTTSTTSTPPAPSPHPQEAGRRANIGRRPPCWLVRDQSEGSHHHQGSVPSSLMYSSSSTCIKVEDGQAQLAASLTVELNKGDPFSWSKQSLFCHCERLSPVCWRCQIFPARSQWLTQILMSRFQRSSSEKLFG